MSGGTIEVAPGDPGRIRFEASTRLFAVLSTAGVLFLELAMLREGLVGIPLWFGPVAWVWVVGLNYLFGKSAARGFVAEMVDLDGRGPVRGCALRAAPATTPPTIGPTLPRSAVRCAASCLSRRRSPQTLPRRRMQTTLHARASLVDAPAVNGRIASVGYEPLVDVSAKNCEAAVIFAALQSAGFDVVVDCDLRGWMYWYRPFIALTRPITIWIRTDQREDALAYIQAPVEGFGSDDDLPCDGFWGRTREMRGPLSAACLVLMFFVGF